MTGSSLPKLLYRNKYRRKGGDRKTERKRKNNNQIKPKRKFETKPTQLLRNLNLKTTKKDSRTCPTAEYAFEWNFVSLHFIRTVRFNEFIALIDLAGIIRAAQCNCRISSYWPINWNSFTLHLVDWQSSSSLPVGQRNFVLGANVSPIKVRAAV